MGLDACPPGEAPTVLGRVRLRSDTAEAAMQSRKPKAPELRTQACLPSRFMRHPTKLRRELKLDISKPLA